MTEHIVPDEQEDDTNQVVLPLIEEEEDEETTQIIEPTPKPSGLALTEKELAILRYGFLRKLRKRDFTPQEVFASSETFQRLVFLNYLRRVGVGLYTTTYFGFELGLEAPPLVTPRVKPFTSWVITPVVPQALVGGDWLIAADRFHPERPIQGATPFQIDNVEWSEKAVRAEYHLISHQDQEIHRTIWWNSGVVALKVEVS